MREGFPTPAPESEAIAGLPYTKLDQAEERIIDIEGEIKDRLYQLEQLGENMSVDVPNDNEKKKIKLRRPDWDKVEALLVEIENIDEKHLSESDKKVLELLNELRFLRSHLSDEKRFVKKEFDPVQMLLEQGNARLYVPPQPRGISAEVRPPYDKDNTDLIVDDAVEKSFKLKKEMYDQGRRRKRKWSELLKLGEGRYGILRRLGEGGMGGVWLAWDVNLMDFVVIKEVLSKWKNDQELLDRFKREIVALDAVQSDHVVSPTDVVKISDKPGDVGVVMKLVEGDNLEQENLQGDFDKASIDEVDKSIAGKMIQVLFGLEDLHKRGLVHRDLKLDNVIDTENGVKIIDLGLAGVVGEEVTHLDEFIEDRSAGNEKKKRGLAHLTKPNSPIGTPLYASPESLAGRSNDPRSDLYSAGVMLYIMLTGNYPVNDLDENSRPKSYEELIAEKNREEIMDPSLIRSGDDISVLENITMRLLRANPDERPATARETAELIAGAMVFAYPEITDDEQYKQIFFKLDQKPQDLVKKYRQWVGKSPDNANVANVNE